MAENWDHIWKNYKRGNPIGRLGKISGFKKIAEVTEKINLPKTAKIIDVGCGTGETTDNFRKLGFINAIGIDNSEKALEICEKDFRLKKSKDVFLVDLVNSNKLGKFDFVFSGGLIEHYKDTDIVVKPLCDLSNKWILIFQPNIWTPIDVLKRLYQKTGRASWEYEYRYSFKDYTKWFEKHGFKVNMHGTYNYTENLWILFEKN